MKKSMQFITGLLFTFSTVTCIAQNGGKNYLPVNGDKYVSFGVNYQNATIYYRKYKENSFSQWGIGGNLTFSTTPDAGTSFRYKKTEGTDLSYKYLEVTPMITYGKARRVKITDRMETFIGLNYSFGIQVLSLTENHTLVDSTKLNWYNTPFNHFSYNNDYSNRQMTSISITGTISPFLGANYFVSEKLALGGYFSFGGFNLTMPIQGNETIDTKTQGQIATSNNSVSRVHSGLAAKLAFNGSGGILITYSIK